MINVCSQCFKLNPLDRETCHHCHGECQRIHSLAFSHFRLSCQNGKNKESPGKMEEEADWEKIDSIPEIRMGIDCWAQEEGEIIFARP